MPFHHNVAATWKSLVLWHNVAGTWKKIALHHNVAGVWKQLTYLFGATLNSASYGNTKLSPLNAVSGIRIRSDGTVDRLAYTTYTDQYTWLTGGGVNSDYEVRWTSTSGSLSLGTEGTWLPLSTTREFSRNCTDNFDSSISCTGTLEIRAGGTVLATATITLTASVTT